ncbi:MAG: hypothetical protein KGI41_00585 [Patescibacteria group bacterium]|nr:hypothetical protein [Patescibacteria group bacterium]
MFRRRIRRTYRFHEIDPDEVLVDASNLPSFEPGHMEGRLERPIGDGAFLGLGIVIALVLAGLLGRAWYLEVERGPSYAAISEQNQLDSSVLFADRGVITDRNGVPLVTNVALPDGSVRRLYRSPGFSNVLGYVSYPRKDSNGNYYDTDITGLAGIEKSENALLAGQNGTLLVEKDALGRVVSQGKVIPPVNGKSLRLTIDARVEQAMYDAIQQVSERMRFNSGGGIIMDVRTGELLALVSYPQYDSNVLSSGGPSSTIALYNTDPRHVYLNRPVQGLYTPGSVVKTIEAAGALTDGVITPDYTINDTGSISVPNPYDPAHPNIFVDWKVLGTENLEKAIAWSSDVYFYMVGGGYGGIKGLGIDRLAYWFKSFGFDSATGVALPGENSGFVPTPAWKEAAYGKAWNIGDTYHTAIGQYAVQVTPIELTRAIAAVANDGTLLTPTLLEGEPVQGTRVPASASALAVARAGMRLSVTSALASPLDFPYVEVAAKTGTAQVGVNNEYDNAWVEGFFPYQDPKYAFVVVLERGPSGSGEQGVSVMQQVFTELEQTAPEYFK